MKEYISFAFKVAVALMIINVISGLVPPLGAIIANPLGGFQGILGGGSK